MTPQTERRSSPGYGRRSLLDGFHKEAERRWGGDPPSDQSIGVWAERTPVVLDGRPFSFEGHEYLREPYADDHPHQVEKKCTQVGCTVKAILKVLHRAKSRRYKGILYLFPSKTDVLDFSKSRVTPLIDDNPETIGRWIRDTDSASLKQVGSTFLYLRGMQTKLGLKSVPADLVVYDELDEAAQSMVEYAEARLAHSDYKEQWKLSNPTLPDYGIDKAFQTSDQRHWLLKCPACNHWNFLNETFPDCLRTLPGGRVIRACSRCGGELDPAQGQWVAKRPDVTDVRGRHYSQLFSRFVDPGAILKKYRETDKLGEFYNLWLGEAWADARSRLTVEAVLALCGDQGMASSSQDPSSMGVDQGKGLHVVIGGRRRSDPPGEIKYVGQHRDFEELDALMKDFRVTCCVIDAMPETRAARAFAERHRGRVFLNYYNEHQKGSYKWNEQELIVQCNRTESLDASHEQVCPTPRNGVEVVPTIVLPRRVPELEVFAEQLHNTAKKLERDEESGSQRYVYVRLGPDHYRHAFNYEAMARTRTAAPGGTVYETVTERDDRRRTF